MADKKERPSRSVLDYETEDALRRALMAVEINEPSSRSPSAKNDSAGKAEPPLDLDNGLPQAAQEEQLDWVLTNYDAETTEAQSMKEELKRLMVLKSYLILDAKRETQFEKITGIASRVFNAPIALVSLLDLGRQWFMSNRGLGDCRETPRKVAFCAHVVQSKKDVFIVPDATKDFRFKDNALVTGPPHLRFYAGVPLITPEGYKIGTFCVLDMKPRPEGLSESEIETLKDMAELVITTMVHRRSRLRAEDSPEKLIAHTAHDLMTPLTGVQLSLSLLKEDEDIQQKMDPHQKELIHTASTCSDLMIRICQTTIKTLREGVRGEPEEKNDDLLGSSARSLTMGSDLPVTTMADLLNSLQLILEPIPKNVPYIMKLDPSVPSKIVCDDLKVFRSALNLITSALNRTTVGFTKFRIYPKDETDEGQELVFEVEDTAENIPQSEYSRLFKPSTSEDGSLLLCLSSVASLISSIDGNYGFKPRRFAKAAPGETVSRHQTGSIFWFSVPLIPYSESGGMRPTAIVRKSATSAYTRKEPIVPIARRGSNSSVSSLGNKRMPLHLSDHFQAETLNQSCLGSVFEAHPLDIPTTISHPASSSSGFHQAHGLTSMSESSQNHSLPVISMPDASPSSSAHKMVSNVETRDSSRREKCALVIDDSLVVRKSLSMALKKFGFKASVAVDGLDGLKQMQGSHFDLVLCDFLMPVMDGFDCVKQYREWERSQRPGYHQFIVGISAHANSEVAAQGKDAGMDSFNPKPIGFKFLAELIKTDRMKESSRVLDQMAGIMSIVPDVASDTSDGHDSLPNPHSLVSARKRESDAKDRNNLQNGDGDGLPERNRSGPKRLRINSTDKPKNGREQLCLIATDRPNKSSSEALSQMESSGWKVVVVHDSNEAQKMLETRNWDAVLIDDDLPSTGGALCIGKFRDWERNNRVNRQKNTFFVSDVDCIPSPSDPDSVVQPPRGFDYVVRKPDVWIDLKYLLESKDKDQNMTIITK